MSLDIFLVFFEENILLMLAIVAFLSQIGIPLGAMFVIMLAGSTTLDLGYLIVIIVTIAVSAILGDISAYKAGERFGSAFMEKYRDKTFVANAYEKSKAVMVQYGASGIFFSRFLISGMGPPINYLAGLDRYSFKKFLALVLMGEILYGSIFASLGYLFKETWEELLGVLSDFSLIALLLVILFVLSKKIYAQMRHDK